MRNALAPIQSNSIGLAIFKRSWPEWLPVVIEPTADRLIPTLIRPSVIGPLQPFALLGSLGIVSGKKLIAVSWWTFAYVVFAGTLFVFSAMGDCLQGSEGSACRHQSGMLSNAVLLIEVVAYIALTWLLFFRRR